jgi:Glycosyltransferase family 87
MSGRWLRGGAMVVLAAISLLMLSDFVLRGMALAFAPDRTDFSEVYVGAWLWRHGGNFYDSALATATQQRLIGDSTVCATLYPPTTFALFAPFSYLSWGWANLIWLMIGLMGIGATIFFLWKLGNLKAWDIKSALFVTFILSFSPLHQAFHLGNMALLAVPLVLGGIWLAESARNWPAGVMLGFATCLKPQIGIWVLLYYLLRARWRLIVGAGVTGLCAAALLLLHPIPVSDAIVHYKANQWYWFAPGHPAGFTPGGFPYHVNMFQVILYQLLHSVAAANWIARILFAAGIVIWLVILRRAKFRVPVALAISSIIALSFVSMYHSVSDVTVLTLALCWAIPEDSQPWTSARTAVCAIFLLMMLPGHSVLMRFSPRLPQVVTISWWWSLFVARYFVWLLFALNVALLAGLWGAEKSEVGSQNAEVKPSTRYPVLSTQ